MGLSDSFFATRFNITERDLERYLDEALSRGGDYSSITPDGKQENGHGAAESTARYK